MMQSFTKAVVAAVMLIVCALSADCQDDFRLSIPIKVDSKLGIPLLMRSVSNGKELAIPATEVDVIENRTLVSYDVKKLSGKWIARIGGGTHGRLEWVWYCECEFPGKEGRVIEMPDRGVKISICIPTGFLASPEFRGDDLIVNFTRLKDGGVDPFFFVWDAARFSKDKPEMETFLPFIEAGEYTVSIVSAAVGKIHFQRFFELKPSNLSNFLEAQQNEPKVRIKIIDADRWFGVVSSQPVK